MNKKFLSRKETAEFLLITEDSLNNWERQKKISSIDNAFLLKDIHKLKEQIKEGKFSRLTNRANKLYSTKNITPAEIIECNISNKDLNHLITHCENSYLHLKEIIFLAAIKALVNAGEIQSEKLDHIVTFDKNIYSRQNIILILSNFSKLNKINISTSHYAFFNTLPDNFNFKFIAPLYQSLLTEGKKSRTGSYYTPHSIINQMIENHIKSDTRILDPCCGTGQFLERFSLHIDNPEQIYGYDIDETAIFIARIAMLNCYRHLDFTPNIFLKNYLTEQSGELFDIIATNPPWGFRFSGSEKAHLSKLYPDITSSESFSFFIANSLNALKAEGILSILVPEAISNSIGHWDIRKLLLNNKILKIMNHGKKFTHVFTNVISLEIQKSSSPLGHKILNNTGTKTFYIVQQKLKESPFFIYPVYMEPDALKIRDKIFSHPHDTLENNAEWALGIVTGNNKACLQPKAIEGHEAVYTGTEIQPYTLLKPKHYLNLKNHCFQQMAPIERYRAKEKLIYRFIFNKMVFAYDNKQCLTLNSANILIPDTNKFSLFYILALFNSPLYNFLYQKCFHSLKVIRTYLETLPIPRISHSHLNEIESLVQKIINQEASINSMDNLIYSLFDLNKDEITYIESNIK
ncbi:MAG: N-6 DNA methylase [Spirochaetales bacterium]|nr:N-6 DNA methylase [Spirochaetales bacterium]